MRLLINLENTDDIRDIVIETNDSLETLRYIIEAEFAIPFIEQEIKFEGKVLNGDSQKIATFKVNENEILIISRRQKSQTLASVFDETMKKLKENKPVNNQQSNLFNPAFNEKMAIDMRVKQESKQLKDHYNNSPGDLAVLFNTDLKLAEAIVGGDDLFLEDFIRKRLEKMIEKKKKEDEDHKKLMNSDPNDLEAQKKIEEMIRLKNIDENYKMAHEYLPMTFSSIFMLYIPLEINKSKLNALVDTGAQMTIMGQDCCKKAGLFNMVDTRCKGTAVGVGSTKIIGVIHAAQIKINER
jgi:DNA damage-inducible protein 1